MKKTDVAAYVWPSYTGDEERSLQFWPEGNGEWQTVRDTKPKFEGHLWPRRPLWGFVNEADPKVMEMEIDEAVSHGVNVFIYDWYWYDDKPFLEQCLDNGFLKAKNSSKMKFYLMWANHDATNCWDKKTSDSPRVIWTGYQNMDKFRELVKYWIEKYFKLDNYYKIDGRPVFMIYEYENLVFGFNNDDNLAKEAMEYFRSEVKKAGFPDVYLQVVLIPTGWDAILEFKDHKFYNYVTNIKESLQKVGFDAATLYQSVHAVKWGPRLYDYEDVIKWIDDFQNGAEEKYGLTYIPHATVGWDSNPRYNNFRNGIFMNNGPENFKKALLTCRDYLDRHPNQPRLVVVNSWNEWTEDSYLEPDDLHGYGYLDAVKEVFGND